MDGFKHTLEAIPEGSTRRKYGTAYWDGTQWSVNINGKLVGCRWLDPIQPVQGGKLLVDITNEGRGQYSAWVMGGYTDQPRPSTGSVVSVIPAGVATEIVFTGEDGNEYVTDRFIGSYSPGDPVYLTWDAARPTIIGKIAAIAPPPSAPAPPPAATVTTGTQRSPASATDTWWGPGGWGSYATSRGGGEDIYSGSYGSGPTTGAWFYGPANTVLAGKTIQRARFRVPARLNAGGYNSDAVVHLYAHTSQSRPGGDVSRTAGPHDITVPARYIPGGHTFSPGLPPGWIELPASFHAVLAAGGGISISGDPYVGFQGRLKDPESGKLEIDWTA